MIMIMVMVGAVGVDLMRSEMERTRIQAVSDQAVLAAADLDQQLDPEAVARDYFAKYGMSDLQLNVAVDEGLNYRTVQVTAGKTLDTPFLAKVGTPTMEIRSASVAEERVAKVEISLVLDISGSMENNNKMYNLRNAAGVFVDTVLKPENKDLISVSVVPYSEQVNVGPEIASRLYVEYVHPFGDMRPDWNSWSNPAPVGVNCLEIPESEFSSAALNKNLIYEQVQHFQFNPASLRTVVDTVCPQYEYERIIPFSQNRSYLKQQINKLQPRAGTSIFLGLKWGAAMLDPSFRSLTQSMSYAGAVDGVFAARPASYQDIQTLKTVILMTDGQNDKSYRITRSVYANYDHAYHWATNNFLTWLSNNVYYRDRPAWYWQKYTASLGDHLLGNICDAAKEQGIVIWSIGFEVTNHGADVMRTCASSPSHFFRVEGVEISKAFEAIARQINQLRLTQ